MEGNPHGSFGCSNNQIDTRQINIRKKSKFNHVCTAVSQLPFPAGSIGKECAYNARNVGDVDSMPGLGKYPGEEIGNLLQYSCLRNPMDRGAWWSTVLGVAKESGMT